MTTFIPTDASINEGIVDDEVYKMKTQVEEDTLVAGGCRKLPTHGKTHNEIAMEQEIPCKYRTPYEFVDCSENHVVTEVVVDAGGNEVEIFGDTGWVGCDEAGLLDMFGELNAYREGEGKVEWDKVDYEIYGEDYYREKYPNFPPEWYALLVHASKEKFKDLQSGRTEGLKVTRGDHVVKFD